MKLIQNLKVTNEELTRRLYVPFLHGDLLVIIQDGEYLVIEVSGEPRYDAIVVGEKVKSLTRLLRSEPRDLVHIFHTNFKFEIFAMTAIKEDYLSDFLSLEEETEIGNLTKAIQLLDGPNYLGLFPATNKLLNKAVDDLALVAKSLLESLKAGSKTDTRVQDVVTSFGHNRGDLIKIVAEQNITDPAVIFAFPSIKFIFLRSELEKIEEQDGANSNDEVQKRFALNLLPAFQFMESYIAKGTCDGLPSTNIVQIVEGLISNMNTFVNNIVCDKGSSVMKSEEEKLMTNRDLNTEIQGGFKQGDLVVVAAKQDVGKFD